MRVPLTRERQLVNLNMWLFMALTALWALLASTILAYSQTRPPPSSDSTPGTTLDRRDRLGTPVECADENGRTPRTDGVNLFCPDDDPTMDNRDRRPTSPGGSIPPPAEGMAPDSSMLPPSDNTIPPVPRTRGTNPPSPLTGGTVLSTSPAGGSLAHDR